MAIRGGMAQAWAAALVLTAASPAVAQTAADLFYQRAVMIAADGACHLFAPDVSASLAASLAQARGAALRSGLDAASLDSVSARASAAVSAAGCGSPAIAAAAKQVQGAFAGYAHLDRMDFPGELEGWTAARPAADAGAQWRVVQRDRFGWDTMWFGVVGNGDGRPLIAAASFADGGQPYGARLVMRDASLTSGPFLDPRQADIAGRIPIDSRLPPRSATQVFNAEAMSTAGGGLVGGDPAGGWAFRFPAAAADALSGLDPREAVAVEFLFAGPEGEAVRTAYVEVGDFAAARAFQQVAQR